MTLSTQEVSLVCQMVDDLAGIQWDIDKAYLIESRLRSLLSEHGCADMTELVQRVRRGDEVVREAVLDAVTTRETLFFRDDAPFAALRNKALPEIIDARGRTSFPQRLRLWSAACSSGQEPYSLAITLCETIEDIDDWDVQILATDLSPAAIESASRGIYSDFEMSRGVPDALRNKYFTKADNGWRICDRIRSMVAFQLRNLLQPFDDLGQFDVIFCRNVAIYFDLPTKTCLFSRLAKVLANHGAIFVGGSETLSYMGDRWRPQHHCRGVYYQPHQVLSDVPVRDHTPARLAAEVARPPARPLSTSQVAKQATTAPATSVLRPLVTVPPSVSSGATRLTSRSAVPGLTSLVGQSVSRPAGTAPIANARPPASSTGAPLGARRAVLASQAVPVASASTAKLGSAKQATAFAPVGQIGPSPASGLRSTTIRSTVSPVGPTSKSVGSLGATAANKPASVLLTNRPPISAASRSLLGTSSRPLVNPPKVPARKSLGSSLVTTKAAARPGDVVRPLDASAVKSSTTLGASTRTVLPTSLNTKAAPPIPPRSK